MATARPDEVYNLGAISFVAYSWENAHLTTEVTAQGVLNMLEAVRLHSGDDPGRVRFYQASSSEMFGRLQEVPAARDHAAAPPLAVWGGQGLRPLHDDQLPRVLRHACQQGSSSTTSRRVAAAFVTRKVARRGPDRPRHQTGHHRQPGRTARLGLRGRLRRGDVADAPAARGRRLRRGHRGDPLHPRPALCRLRPRRHRRLVGQGRAPDPRFLRPAEVDLLVGDPTKARERLGWKPHGRLRGPGPDDGRGRPRGAAPR